ncbi:hypothetical protein [Sphingomonas sp. SRS2]|uniref:hypothetical protein n=1 Tax=Sphingomonas sp. SRS2 TaxID=133190 RepID=UPI00128DF65B|nr:hypothetical protein [Sphingomonas sp. SRS2]
MQLQLDKMMPMRLKPNADRRFALWGSAAVEGLSRLITKAVSSADDERVSELDRILQQVEAMIDLHGLKAIESDSPPLSVHEQQAPYRTVNLPPKQQPRGD